MHESRTVGLSAETSKKGDILQGEGFDSLCGLAACMNCSSRSWMLYLRTAYSDTVLCLVYFPSSTNNSFAMATLFARFICAGRRYGWINSGDFDPAQGGNSTGNVTDHWDPIKFT
eukprot:886612-Prorocentrum_minimum.AAC.7